MTAEQVIAQAIADVQCVQDALIEAGRKLKETK